MTASVRVLTTRTLDSSPALLLIEPGGSKTLINCGEGCQRSFLEHGQKLASVHRVCLTHLAHDSLGGLPGMILTSADSAKAAQVNLMELKAGVGAAAAAAAAAAKESTTNHNALPLQGLELLGPLGTKHYVRSLRHFVRRDDFPVTVREGTYLAAPATSQEEHGEHQRAKKKKRKRQEGNRPSAAASAPKTEELHRCYFGVQTIPVPYHIPLSENAAAAAASRSGSSDSKGEVVSFVFTTPPISGKFLPSKAKELGIPPGPLYAKLKKGETVTFRGAQGVQQKVESSQVVLESTPGVVVAVLYYPTLDVWKALQPRLNDILRDKEHQSALDIVVHMTSHDIFLAPVCQEWRQEQQASPAPNDTKPPTEVQHLFVETSDPAIWRQPPRRSPSPFTSACVGALVRSEICPEVYKTPDYLLEASGKEHTHVDNKQQGGERYVRTAVSMLDYVLMPRGRKGYAALSQTTLDDRRREGLEKLANSGALSHARELLKQQPPTDSTEERPTDSKAELLFTGTGSALPCRHRNVTGMCLRMDDGQGILLDVGEGTVGQLLRASKEEVAETLCSIQAAWVSHPHADHHLGLIRFLTDRQAALDLIASQNDDNGSSTQSYPVVVIGPPPIVDFLREYEQIDPRIAGSYSALDCRELVQDNPNRPLASTPRVMQENSLLGGHITSLEAIPVAHCPYSYAVVLKGTSFGTVAYSGDCRPSGRFAQQAHNADLLIHEATFEDGMEAEAAMKRHCTVGEALSVARDMRAKRVVLTHFSQRYPKIPPLLSTVNNGAGSSRIDDPSSSDDIPVTFAFDFMALTPTNLAMSSQLTPALRRLYPEDPEVDTTEVPAAMSIPGFFAQNPYE